MLRLAKRIVDEMVEHARQDLPNEACGIIAGKDGQAVKLFRARNAEASPYRYSVHTDDLFRIWRECEQNGWEFFVVYHSHVDSEAYPSATDVRLAYWAEPFYVVVSLQEPDAPLVRAFRIVDGQVSEEELLVG
ncbi:MAG TPA: M67 family metallopeptidase [Dehalococcoidia bacterium]|nr:M67 family metallopeptidase [Dehalococcoidia bacterium]